MWRTPEIVAYDESLGCKAQIQHQGGKERQQKLPFEQLKYSFTNIKCNFLTFKLWEEDFVWKILSAWNTEKQVIVIQ